MINLKLSKEQAQVLAEYLESDISGLHTEIVRTSDRDFKEGLKHKREILDKVLQSLQAKAS